MNNLSADQRQKTIASVRSRDTRAELIVPRTLHFIRWHLRLHKRDLPGRPDITLAS
jgi:DNA mismatch endonuclease (patch repair protein)